MAESKDYLVGAYSATAPSFNPSSYTTYEDLLNIVKEIIFTADKGGGVMGGLSNSDPAEAWYELEADVNAATKRLGEVNEKFAAEIKNMRDHLKGEAGEAFDTYATDMLRESETVWQTLEDKKFGVTIGNVGHVIQATSAAWWEAVYQNAKDLKSQQDLLRDKGVKTLEDLSDNYYDAEIQSLINKVVEATNTAVENASTEAKEKLVSRLQELLTSLGNQYSDRGRELSPIQIVNGEAKANDERFNTSGGGDGNGNGNGDNDDNDNDEEDEEGTGGGSGGGSGSGGGEDYDEGVNDAQDAANEALDELIENETDPEKREALEDAKEAVNEALDGLEGGGEGAGGTPASSHPSAEGDAGIPQTSSGGPSGGGGTSGGSGAGAGDSARQQALEDAQNAANDAIEGLMSPGGGGETGAGAGGGGVPAGGMSPGGGSSGSGGAGGQEDAKRAKALEDAKKAANDAIEGLTGGGSGTDGGSGVPGGEYSPEQQKAIDDAKAAAGKAIDDLAAGTDDPARKEALEDAKKAAQDAIGELGEAGGGGQPPTSSNGPGGSGEPLDPETAKALQDAKDTTGKAIDDMIAATDDPQQKQALLDAKEAAEDAIDNLIDPEHQEAVADAKDAAGEAIDKLGREGDSPQDKQALQDARNAAREAIDSLDGALDPNDPGYQKAVDDAKSKVDEAIDKLAKPGDSPERTAALEQAKEAAHKAIDGITKSDAALPGLARKSTLDDFLSPSGGGGGGSTGGGGGGGGGGLDIPEFGGPGGNDPNSPAQFDVAAERGLSPVGQQLSTAAVAATPGVPAGAMSPGMPMGGGGMPMGGMGGMGGAGGRGDNTREPQIWMQADPGAWGEDGETEPKPVLGRE